MSGPSGGSLGVDFSLERLSGFGDLLQHCRGLVRLEATGNELISLAGEAVMLLAFCYIMSCAVL